MDEPPATPPPPDRPLPEPPEPGLSAENGRRPAPRPEQPAENPNAGWFLLVGGVLVIVGVLLPWITFTDGASTVTAKGSDLAGWGFYILGGFAIVRGVSMTRPDRFSFRLGTPLIGGVILAVLIATHWSRLRDLLDVAAARGVDGSIGIGYWIVVAGAACVLIGGLLSMRRRT
jgi:hypothetical protein